MQIIYVQWRIYEFFCIWTLILSLYCLTMFSSLPLKEMCFSDWRGNDSESRLFMLLFFLLSDESKHILIAYRDSIRLGRDKSDFGIEPPTAILYKTTWDISKRRKGRVTAHFYDAVNVLETIFEHAFFKIWHNTRKTIDVYLHRTVRRYCLRLSTQQLRSSCLHFPYYNDIIGVLEQHHWLRLVSTRNQRKETLTPMSIIFVKMLYG